MPQPRTRTTDRSKIIDENLRKKWRRKEGLALLEGMARDGYSDKEIAQKMKISPGQLQRLRDNDQKIRKALDHGKMETDYLVEKALLKSAVGFRRKQIRVTSIIRYGKLVETQKEEFEEDVAPNVMAAQTWLYNRCPDKWKRDPQKGILDNIDEDTSIKIEVTRAGYKEDEDDKEWQEEVNKEVKIRKATKEEQEEAKKKNEEKKSKIKAEQEEVEQIKSDEEEDIDAWPDDWEEMIEDDED